MLSLLLYALFDLLFCASSFFDIGFFITKIFTYSVSLDKILFKSSMYMSFIGMEGNNESFD